MKVDPNQNVVPCLEMIYNSPADGRLTGIIPDHGGIPLRLELAARFLAPSATEIGLADMDRVSAVCLRLADILIAAHNETCEVKP